ncbi:type II toxin-antitoxin system VapC family toxin [uncultured Mucilaginibacter sp.]|uniref:type II toxin-antitoxin system VapC family toxin n=1 Tax=uncultured Mucilaginibacter sp. TaxID=797541 RepID=UPI0025DE35F5|nr:type II toxin-antitoxin system VapC family toxin [uncultured Mucilaginibacter sp.]
MAKKIIICDTDVMIDYLNINSQRHPSTKNILKNLIGLDNILLSAITKMELIVGATNKTDLNNINKNIHKFSIALIGDGVTQTAIQLLQEYKLSHGLALPDALIAATALILELELYTYNIKDYKFINSLVLFEPANQ